MAKKKKKTTAKKKAPKKTSASWDKKKTWKKRFITALRKTGNVKAAATVVDRDVSGIYKEQKLDPKFGKAWVTAREEYLERRMRDELQTAMATRAIEGWLEPVYHDGQVVGAKRKFSDTLQIFMAKSHMPERYGDRIEVTSRDYEPDDRYD